MTMKYKAATTMTRDMAATILHDMHMGRDLVAVFWHKAQKLATKNPVAKKTSPKRIRKVA